MRAFVCEYVARDIHLYTLPHVRPQRCARFIHSVVPGRSSSSCACSATRIAGCGARARALLCILSKYEFRAFGFTPVRRSAQHAHNHNVLAFIIHIYNTHAHICVCMCIHIAWPGVHNKRQRCCSTFHCVCVCVAREREAVSRRAMQFIGQKLLNCGFMRFGALSVVRARACVRAPPWTPSLSCENNQFERVRSHAPRSNTSSASM